jgi:hypothetical protein
MNERRKLVFNPSEQKKKTDLRAVNERILLA